MFNHLLLPACKTCKGVERLMCLNLRNLLMSHVQESAAVCGSNEGVALLNVLWCVKRNGQNSTAHCQARLKVESLSHTRTRGRQSWFGPEINQLSPFFFEPFDRISSKSVNLPQKTKRSSATLASLLSFSE